MNLIQRKINLNLFLLFILLTPSIFTKVFGQNQNLKPNVQFGFEISELSQNNFSHLGTRNFTFFFGQEFWFNELQNFGYRVLIINVDLSSEHLKENVFIKG
ncbi:MAG: hypothetical protein ACK4KT_10400, partial [Thermaurantimonas sp.]